MKLRNVALTATAALMMVVGPGGDAWATGPGNYYIGSSNPLAYCASIASTPFGGYTSGDVETGQSFYVEAPSGNNTTTPMSGVSGEFVGPSELVYVYEILYSDQFGNIAAAFPDGTAPGSPQGDPYSSINHPLYWHITASGNIDYFSNSQGYEWYADTMDDSGTAGFATPIRNTWHPTMWVYFYDTNNGNYLAYHYGCGKTLTTS